MYKYNRRQGLVLIGIWKIFLRSLQGAHRLRRPWGLTPGPWGPPVALPEIRPWAHITHSSSQISCYQIWCLLSWVSTSLCPFFRLIAAFLKIYIYLAFVWNVLIFILLSMSLVVKNTLKYGVQIDLHFFFFNNVSPYHSLYEDESKDTLCLII